MPDPTLYNRAVEPMDEATTETFIKLTWVDAGYPNFRDDPRYKEMVGVPHVNIIANRLHPSGCKITTPALLMVAYLCHSPGDCVLWAYTILTRWRARDVPIYTIEHLTEDFRDGFPTMQSRADAWDEQKGPDWPTGNWLDTAEPWQ